MQPWFANIRFPSLKKDVAKLVDVMHKYALFLAAQNEKVKAHHLFNASKEKEPNATLITLSARDGPIRDFIRVQSELYERLETLSLYEPPFLNEIAPTYRYDHRQWLSELQLPFPVIL